VAGLLCGGTVVYLAGFAFTRWVMFRTVARSRLIAATAVLAVLPVGLAVPAAVTLGLLAAVLSLLNIFEYAYVRRASQPHVPAQAGGVIRDGGPSEAVEGAPTLDNAG
jgi:hypothetical protein